MDVKYLAKHISFIHTLKKYHISLNLDFNNSIDDIDLLNHPSVLRNGPYEIFLFFQNIKNTVSVKCNEASLEHLQI